MSAVTIDHLLAPVRVRPARPAVVIPFPAGAREAVPAAGPRLRITRRGRLVVTVAVVLAVSAVAVTALVPAPSGGAGAGRAPVAMQELQHVVVTPGDTLWEIASSLSAPGQDVRDLIADIRELNGLETSGVVAGQELLIPAAG